MLITEKLLEGVLLSDLECPIRIKYEKYENRFSAYLSVLACHMDM